MAKKKTAVKTPDYSKPPPPLTRDERTTLSRILAKARAQRRYNEFQAKKGSSSKKAK